MGKFTHIDDEGRVRMVDVTDKKPSVREAIAGGVVFISSQTFELIRNQKIKKGNVLETARIAGIMAAKKTHELIPLAHPINITAVEVELIPEPDNNAVYCEATVHCAGQTGVEMEALTAVNIALLTVYDMCKAVDRGMEMEVIRLLKKSGGKSGEWVRED